MAVRNALAGLRDVNLDVQIFMAGAVSDDLWTCGSLSEIGESFENFVNHSILWTLKCRSATETA